MANPAPTLNQINAFNATIGTTIDFNIIGGTEVIRSNRIYIYDLSDNSLICTHLYVSTEPIHELPPNTSTSIVYESGKSSADFTNNTQYYAQIQTYTDTNGTQGASGLSIAKLFWCLPTPTLTLATIPTTISTTSYNVSATYTPNTSGGTTNEIQEFQFNLYSAIGALLQTSDVVLYGEGVDLSYNFSGLEVNSTYYVTLDVTTTQGMNVSAQSDTFTVSVDTPTMGSASVVNNGCDGYISVTSNLSSEYSHEQSVDAGEVMSFTTDSPNDIKELQVDFHPIQDGTPWMSTPDTEPYMFRAVPPQTEDFGYESDTIIGGTVGWNQLCVTPFSTTAYGVTFTRDVDKKSVTMSGTATSNIYRPFNDMDKTIIGHVYYVDRDTTNTDIWIYNDNGGVICSTNKATVGKATKNNLFYLRINNGATVDETITPQIMDLTQMFGSTIADYIYSLEQATAGAGVAWFRKLFPKSYYAYNAVELMSVNTSAHNTVGFNQWDEEWELGVLNSDGTIGTASNRIVTKNYIPVVPNSTYCLTTPFSYNIKGRGAYYNANKELLSYFADFPISSSGNYGTNGDMYWNRFIVPEGAYYLKYSLPANYGTSYNDDICINLSWDGERDGEYEAYEKHSYPLDADLELRGIPKLDASNNLYYDGDTYEADGTVTRKYGIVDLGTLNWARNTTNQFYTTLPTASVNNTTNMITNGYIASSYGAYNNNVDRSLTINGASGARLWCRDTRYDDLSSFVSAMSGVYLVYELATPTTETADPYTNPQIVDQSGTEEYVGSPIPVGHKTTYQRICPITGWTGCEVDVSGVNLLDPQTKTEYSANTWRWHYSDGYVLKKNVTYNFSWGNKGNNSFNIYLYIANFDTGANYNAGNNSISYTPTEDIKVKFQAYYSGGIPADAVFQLELGSSATPYTPYNPNSAVYPVSWQTEAGTVYGGYVDLVSGELTVDRASVDMGTLSGWTYNDTSYSYGFFTANMNTRKQGSLELVCSDYATATGGRNTMNSDGMIATYNTTNSNAICIRNDAYTDVTQFRNSLNGVQLVYELATPQTYQLTPHQIQTLVGQNNLWHDTNGEMTIMYQLPITDLLVKRKDVSQVGSQWLTLHSVPVEQASDMDFTYIDFLNQYGKKYQYALVPVLAQDQSGVIVQIEGGYTTSDTIDSVFDGVYIADQTNVERVKAGVGYGNVDMNQGVGSITPIGSKYPVVITNSQNQYHNGSIRGTIVPNDFYSNGNLSRIDMVNKRDELEQFLTNKRAKIIKDWNGKMWLVMFMSNVACSFDDNYGMGMVSFSADWVEIGDPTNQQDLYEAGLINVGGA